MSDKMQNILAEFIAQLKHANLENYIGESSVELDTAYVQLVDAENIIDISINLNFTASISVSCADGSFSTYPTVDTPHEFFMFLGRALEFSSNHSS